MLRIYSRQRKGEEILFWILHKIMEINCFSADIDQCNIADSVVRAELFF